MDTGTDIHLAALKQALLSLDAAGAKGFEGLLATVLSEICGQPFRLASSGSQRGRDENSAFDEGATFFETKLYEGKVESTAVAKKLVAGPRQRGAGRYMGPLCNLAQQPRKH